MITRIQGVSGGMEYVQSRIAADGKFRGIISISAAGFNLDEILTSGPNFFWRKPAVGRDAGVNFIPVEVSVTTDQRYLIRASAVSFKHMNAYTQSEDAKGTDLNDVGFFKTVDEVNLAEFTVDRLSPDVEAIDFNFIRLKPRLNIASNKAGNKFFALEWNTGFGWNQTTYFDVMAVKTHNRQDISDPNQKAPLRISGFKTFLEAGLRLNLEKKNFRFNLYAGYMIQDNIQAKDYEYDIAPYADGGQYAHQKTSPLNAKALKVNQVTQKVTAEMEASWGFKMKASPARVGLFVTTTPWQKVISTTHETGEKFDLSTQGMPVRQQAGMRFYF